MRNEISGPLKTFIEKKMGQYTKPFSRDMLLERDLGISGDKAVEFIDSFSDEFDIIFPADFNYSEHFDIEGLRFDFLKYLMVIFKKESLEQKKIPITVGDLDDAIEKGVWEKEKLNNYPQMIY
jgi:hypothetical protein